MRPWAWGVWIALLAMVVVVPPVHARAHYAEALGLENPREVVEAPDFSLKDLDGRTVRLKDFRGRLVMLNFFATWCAPCRFEMPAMERLYRLYRDKGLLVIAIDIRESAKAVRTFVQAMRLSFPTVLDEDGAIAYVYGIRPVPASYLISRDGKILWRAFGAREWDSAEAREYFARVLMKEN